MNTLFNKDDKLSGTIVSLFLSFLEANIISCSEI
ncbi:unnamed protein product [Acanthoscelides obtectus]|uniref:Uncharacterized protein n=1 Tax=Acanthoscelides obtectus TaxID=200917 RepID=A0A9P0LC76_ACAOB|nr:unnamed protein product [Acanthoscelides obtectus]CAK1620027.1 hypothetical protein AOBTE_LOCUS146 [Acanthoscelides obtectus]